MPLREKFHNPEKCDWASFLPTFLFVNEFASIFTNLAIPEVIDRLICFHCLFLSEFPTIQVPALKNSVFNSD